MSVRPTTSYCYLTRQTGVRSSRMIIAGTRVGVEDVVGMIVHGADVDEVCRRFPGVTRDQVFECLDFYFDHRAEIDDLVARLPIGPRV